MCCRSTVNDFIKKKKKKKKNDNKTTTTTKQQRQQQNNNKTTATTKQQQNNDNNNMYAGRKRRKPAQKGAKPAPAEGAKSNPSKRHRDRLNSELDRLASLLPFPEDVICSLDKLSILRLSVSFLRTKSFFSVALKNQLSNGTSRSRGTGPVDDHVPEGELLLQALNGFVLVVTAEGMIFFCSHTIQDYLGFHQTDVMHQSVFELIHTEDQQEFRRNLHWALNPPAGLRPPLDPSTEGESVPTPPCLVSYSPEQIPPENSSFLERGFICRFRCLLDNSSGFLALNIQGRLKFLHSQSRQHCATKDGTPPQLALFAVATPLQPPAILEIRTRNMIFRTKHKLDFTPMACDAKGKIVLGYTEAELRVRGSGYQFIHAADMLHCAENHVRMMKTGESGLTVFRLLTKDNRWKWVQANARLVYKNGKPDYIIATQRPLVDEEGGEHLRKRSMHLPFTFATGEALLYQTGYPLHSFPDSSQGKANGSKSKKGKLAKSSVDELDPKSLLGALMSQDESVYVCQPDSKPRISYYSSIFSEQQAESEGCGALLTADNWHVVSNGETGRCNGSTSSYDPLLATLDSLDGDNTCSNSELFSALENLGLNAEDLELLLLDERMIQVELDPNNIPTLSDLLTNNEILSYIQDSLENSSEGGQAHPDSAPSVSQQACLAAPSTRQPIVQLSQQMQQCSSTGELLKAVSQPRARDRPNGPWVVSTENHTHHQQHPALKASHKNLHPVVEMSQQWQLQQHQHSAHLQPHQVSSALLPGYQNQLEETTAGSCIPNRSPSCYSICSTPQTGVTTPAICQYQSPPQLQHTQLPPSCLPQCPPQSSALELEQFLGLSQPQHNLPSLEAYSMFSPSSEESSPSKLEDSCLPNAAYMKTYVALNGNGAAATLKAPLIYRTPQNLDSSSEGMTEQRYNLN